MFTHITLQYTHLVLYRKKWQLLHHFLLFNLVWLGYKSYISNLFYTRYKILCLYVHNVFKNWIKSERTVVWQFRLVLDIGRWNIYEINVNIHVQRRFFIPFHLIFSFDQDSLKIICFVKIILITQTVYLFVVKPYKN